MRGKKTARCGKKRKVENPTEEETVNEKKEKTKMKSDEVSEAEKNEAPNSSDPKPEKLEDSTAQLADVGYHLPNVFVCTSFICYPFHIFSGTTEF